MTVIFHAMAEEELDSMDRELRRLFFKHIDKVVQMPPRRHMRLGVPYYVEKVTNKARLVYEKEEGEVTIYHCFATHKEYEKWFKSFK